VRPPSSSHPRPVEPSLFIFADLALYAFIASLPFETIGGGGQSDQAFTLTISRVLGIVWVVSCALRGQLHSPRCHRAFALSALFVVVVAARGVLVDSTFWPEVTSLVQTLIQMVVMLWLITNAVRARPRLYESIAWVYGVSCFVFSILIASGLTATDFSQDKRITGLAEDPNTLAGKLSIGLVLVLGLLWSRKKTPLGIVLLLIATCPVVVFSILQTGSRGGLISLCFGLIVLALPRLLIHGSPLSRITAFALTAALFSLMVYSIASSETVTTRWARTLNGGDMATREDLYPRVLALIAERPFFGWGPAANYSVIGETMGVSRTQSTENSFFWMLTAVGILGAIPLLYVVHVGLISAWRLRRTALGWTPVACFITTMTFASTIEWYLNKVFWLVLAVGIGAAWNATFIPARVRVRPDAMAAIGRRP
jgi:O-antigen ligase